MRTGMLISLIVLGLTAVGCGAEHPLDVVDPSTDPAWIPPGQGDLDVADAPEAKTRAKPRARSLQKPNQRETESRVHTRVSSR